MVKKSGTKSDILSRIIYYVTTGLGSTILFYFAYSTIIALLENLQHLNVVIGIIVVLQLIFVLLSLGPLFVLWKYREITEKKGFRFSLLTLGYVIAYAFFWLILNLVLAS